MTQKLQSIPGHFVKTSGIDWHKMVPGKEDSTWAVGPTTKDFTSSMSGNPSHRDEFSTNNKSSMILPDLIE